MVPTIPLQGPFMKPKIGDFFIASGGFNRSKNNSPLYIKSVLGHSLSRVMNGIFTSQLSVRLISV